VTVKPDKAGQIIASALFIEPSHSDTGRYDFVTSKGNYPVGSQIIGLPGATRSRARI